MKKIIFSIIVLFLFNVKPLCAQIEYGIKAGFNISNLLDGELGEMQPKNKTSFHVGIFINCPLEKYVSFQPEVIYSRQGSLYEYSDLKAWYRIDYINVPLLIRIYPTRILSLDLGPQFGIRASDNFKVKSDGKTSSASTGSNLKALDLSAAFGISLNLSKKVFISARYNLGLSHIGIIVLLPIIIGRLLKTEFFRPAWELKYKNTILRRG